MDHTGATRSKKADRATQPPQPTRRATATRRSNTDRTPTPGAKQRTTQNKTEQPEEHKHNNKYTPATRDIHEATAHPTKSRTQPHNQTTNQQKQYTPTTHSTQHTTKPGRTKHTPRELGKLDTTEATEEKNTQKHNTLPQKTPAQHTETPGTTAQTVQM